MTDTGKNPIEWTKITAGMKVVLVGKKGAQHWEANGRLVTFGSRDQKKAQEWLDRRTHADSHIFIVGINAPRFKK